MKTSATLLVIAGAAFALPASAATTHHHRHHLVAYHHLDHPRSLARLSRYGEPVAPYYSYGQQPPPPIYYVPSDNPPGSIIFRKTIEAQSEPGFTSELAPDAKQTATGGPVGGVPGFSGGLH